MLTFTINALTIVNVIVAIIIINLILMQRSKSGGGLGGITGGAGGGAAEEVFGSGTANVLSRATVVFSIIFMVITLGLTVLQGRVAGGNRNISVVENGMVGDGELPDQAPPDMKPAGSDTPTPDGASAPPPSDGGDAAPEGGDTAAEGEGEDAGAAAPADETDKPE